MPPWDDVLDPDEIEALWAYVIRGEPDWSDTNAVCRCFRQPRVPPGWLPAGLPPMVPTVRSSTYQATFHFHHWAAAPHVPQVPSSKRYRDMSPYRRYRRADSARIVQRTIQRYLIAINKSDRHG